ncbi:MULTISPECIES: DUF2795 domain-containing protein [unclassified Streptomyces]|uniref:DUF2795 domain-containing protein n=1 Tax=unclassified Streptomyces TaxID=2593676 RepID=UPI003D755CE6
MQRGSDRLNVHRDDEMKHELQGLLRSGHPTRSEEWHDPEPAADDDPAVWGGPVAPSGASVETVRLELARSLGRGSFPTATNALVGELRRHHAPDALIDAVRELPPKTQWSSARQVAEALVEERG